MPSNEAIELLESVLSESKNFRKYAKTINDKINKDIDSIPQDPTKSSYINYAKYMLLNPEGRKIRKDANKNLKDFKQRTGKSLIDADYIDFNNEIHTTTPGYKSAAENYKKSIAKDVEKANKAHRGKVIGGYKLEAAMILIEALNTLLNE